MTTFQPTNPTVLQSKLTTLSARDFTTLVQENGSLEKEAKRLIDQAKELAVSLKKEVAYETQLLETQTKSLAGQELQRYIDTTTLERSVETFVAMGRQLEKVHSDFASMQPWLVQLVETALFKIVGSLDEKKVIALAVKEAMRELDPKDTIQMRVNPCDRNAMDQVMARYPSCFVGMGSLLTDPNIAPDRIVLENCAGFLDVSLATQISALSNYLLEELAKDAVR